MLCTLYKKVGYFLNKPRMWQFLLPAKSFFGIIILFLSRKVKLMIKSLPSDFVSVKLLSKNFEDLL